MPKQKQGLNMAQDYAKSFYRSKQWQDCRGGFMQSKYFICERCGGLAVLAHHKTHITPGNINDPNVTLSWDNLMALCNECHQIVHGDSSATAAGVAFDENGDIIFSPDEK